MPDTTNPTVNPATDSILHINEKQFQTVLTSILKKVNERISAHLSLNVTEGDTKHAPVGGAVYTAIQDAITTSTDNGAAKAKEYTDEQIQSLTETVLGINNWNFEKITGEFPEDPDPKTIYLQQDDEEDLSFIMWINTNGEWIDIGNTAFDLLNYWRKDSIEDLSDALVNSDYFMSKLFGGTIEEPDPTETEQAVGTPFVVTADPGSTVTATHRDGDVITAIANEDGKAVLVLPKAGTWDIKITKNGVEEEKPLYVAEKFTAVIGETIKLVVQPNHIVDIIHGSNTSRLTSDEDGNIEFIVDELGEWEVQVCRNDEDIENHLAPIIRQIIITVIAEEEPPKEPTTTEPVIVKADPGTTVTATNSEDGTVVTAVANEDGIAAFLLPKSGTWVITYTKDGDDNTTSVEVTEPETPSTTLDDRYWQKEKIEDLASAVNDLNVFFNRTEKNHYIDLFGVLSNDNEEALANSDLSSDDAIEIKNSAITALDDLTYIRERVLAELLGAVEETEIGDSVTGTPQNLGDNELAFITLPTAGLWKITGTYADPNYEWKEEGDICPGITESMYFFVDEDDAPKFLNSDDLGKLAFSSELSAIQIERNVITPLTPEVVNNTIVKVVQESGALGELGEEDLTNLKEQLELDKLGDTYLTLDATHEAFAIPEEDPINNETMEEAIMRIVNKNSDTIEAISDERLEELMNMAFGDTIPDLDPDPNGGSDVKHKVTVNGDAGTTVTATSSSGKTVTGTIDENGKLTLTLDEEDEWEIEYTNKGETKKDTVTVDKDTTSSTVGDPVSEPINVTLMVENIQVPSDGTSVDIVARCGSQELERTTASQDGSTLGSAIFNIETSGTWFITALVDGKLVTQSITITGDEEDGIVSLDFSGYLLTVTAEPTTDVTFTNGEDNFTQATNTDGVLNVLLKSTGNWTVKTEVDGAEETKSANVTDLSSTENPTLNFTYPLIFKGDPNTAISATNSSGTTLNGTTDDTGHGVLIGEEAGQWTCTVIRNSKSIEDAIIITDGDYDATDVMGDRSNVATDEEVKKGLDDIFGTD